MTEKQKMLSGKLYDASDPVLDAERHHARLLFQKINNMSDEEKEERNKLLYELMGSAGEGMWIEPPFRCDYGYNIHLGKKVFMNFNCCILDVMEVRMGNNVMLGPQVQIYTATHPMDAKERASGLEFAKPVTIGDDVWIGGGAIICPGVTVGDRVVIGAGAVVTKDVPDDVFIGGNPAKIIKKIGVRSEESGVS
jgi:maltose O-acetyltransferase